MKKTIHTLCAVVFALLTIIGCSKSDDNNKEEEKQEKKEEKKEEKKLIKTSNFNIPKEAKDIISEEIMGQMAANGMTINEGMNPPDIQGIFNANTFELVYSNLEEENKGIGLISLDYYFKFYDQKNIKIKTSFTSGGDNIASEQESIISGSGNKFTVYMRVSGTKREATYKIAIVISGEINSEGIRNCMVGLYMLEKNDPNNEILAVKRIRIWVNHDKFAVRE